MYIYTFWDQKHHIFLKGAFSHIVPII